MREKFTPEVIASLSLAFATGLYGVSFGALALASGLSTWQAMALSLIMFSGGSQFAFIGVIAAGGGGAAATASATLLYVRNGIYGAQINRSLSPHGWRKVVAAQLTIDESAGMATLQETQPARRRAFWVTGGAVFAFWNLFTYAGTVVGAQLDPKSWGLDGAAVAAFLALLWPRIKGADTAAIAVVAGFVTMLVIPMAPAGVPIIIAAVVSALLGWKFSGASKAHDVEEP